MISDQYKKQLTKLHQDKNFGNRKDIPTLLKEVIETYSVKSILDFGCGKSVLVNQLKQMYPDINVIGWDPVFNDDTELPSNVDLVISTDVLEHIEPKELDSVLKKLKNISNIAHYHLIACHKAVKILPDGRNAHLIIESPKWWADKLVANSFSIQKEFIESRKSKSKDFTVVKYHCVLLP